MAWLGGDADHDRTVRFHKPNPENLRATNEFPFLGYVTLTFNQTGKYSYFEDNVNDQETSFVMRGTVNVVDSNQKTPVSSSSGTQPVNTSGILMVSSKDLQTHIATLKNNGITTLSECAFTDLRGGQKGTGKTQAIFLWGPEKDNVDQALLPMIDGAKGLPHI